MRTITLCAGLALGTFPHLCLAEPDGNGAAIRAHVTVLSRQVPLNHPVWARFSIENVSAEPITLTVPGTEPDLPSPEVGLPLSHIFSGAGSTASGVSIVTVSGQTWEQPVGFRKPQRAPILLLAPNGTVGTVIDLREYFPSLRGAGTYRLNWQPYGGAAKSNVEQLTIAPRKQVEIVTDAGKMTVRLFYDDAPHHVENFIELVGSGFYTGLTFHRIEPGYLIQGGCPRGDGTGIRTDGKRVAAEFNDRPHHKGSVSMALLGDDPDSASCQFFISNTRMKEWDGRYTVFGELVGDESLQTLDRLMQSPVDAQGRPVATIPMRTVRAVDAPADPSWGSP